MRHGDALAVVPRSEGHGGAGEAHDEHGLAAGKRGALNQVSALTQLLGKSEKDTDVKSTKKRIGREGWAAEIFAKQKPGGWWVHEENLYRPKYLSTNWMLLILSDLGLTKDDPRIARASETLEGQVLKGRRGFRLGRRRSRSHLCIAGNTARALVKFGYADDPKVKSAFEWLVKNQATNGGWSCFGSGGNLDSWEGMSAFAAYPRREVDQEHESGSGEGSRVLPSKVDGPARGSL